jgi:hypothetical protein
MTITDQRRCTPANGHVQRYGDQRCECGEQVTFAASSAPDIDHFWTAVERGWDIEPRAYFEKEAVAMGFASPVEMAVHWMWKRHAKVWPNDELKSKAAAVVDTDTRPACGWSGLRAKVWNRLLDAGVSIGDADEVVRLLAPILETSSPWNFICAHCGAIAQTPHGDQVDSGSTWTCAACGQPTVVTLAAAGPLTHCVCGNVKSATVTCCGECTAEKNGR